MMGKKSIYIILAVALVLSIFIFFNIQNKTIDDVEYSPIDTTLTKSNTNEQKDTVQTVANIFEKYSENTIAFNRKFEAKKFKFKGTISELTKNFFGCGVIVFSITDENDNSIGQVNCMNCKNGTDKWLNTLMKLKVNDEVLIEGFYSEALVENTLTFNRCKLIK